MRSLSSHSVALRYSASQKKKLESLLYSRSVSHTTIKIYMCDGTSESGCSMYRTCLSNTPNLFHKRTASQHAENTLTNGLEADCLASEVLHFIGRTFSYTQARFSSDRAVILTDGWSPVPNCIPDRRPCL